jgi:hypothetical protein
MIRLRRTLISAPFQGIATLRVRSLVYQQGLLKPPLLGTIRICCHLSQCVSMRYLVCFAISGVNFFFLVMAFKEKEHPKKYTLGCLATHCLESFV